MPPVLTTIAGVDYSAASAQPNATWLALGRPRGSVLSIYKVQRTGSDKLAEAIIASGAQLAGLDFPFSWPKAFDDWLKQNRSDSSAFESLQALALKFGQEPRRATDNLSRPKGQSPLHRINPGMLKMTWQGGLLLEQLKQNGFSIAPFDVADTIAAQPTLLEVYPAAVLCSLGLPFRKYKGQEAGAKELRGEILKSLLRLHTVKSVGKTTPQPCKIELPPEFYPIALSSDDALDSIIACYSAFLTLQITDLILPGPVLARYKKQAETPIKGQADAGRPNQEYLGMIEEGWIYSPYSF